MDPIETAETLAYVIVNNIPKSYRSADLRNFFSEFVETSGFDCFHFRHRPEVQQKVPTTKANIDAPTDSSRKDDGSSASTRKTTTCCVVRVLANRVNELFRMYDKKHWIGRDGQSLPTRCFIRKVRVRSSEHQMHSYLTRGEQRALRAEEGAVLTESDLKTLIELRPPAVMPNGNVGTPTKVFLGLIQACKFPPYLIKKLGLVFPRSRSRGLYGSVPFNYGNAARGLKSCEVDAKVAMRKHSDDSLVRTATGAVISGVAPTTHSKTDVSTSQDAEGERHSADTQDKEESDDEECEEWDRHEALHNDVTSQERTRERLFEEELEVQWEKGGSGLVFYTDAQFWDEVEGDFDAKTSDDWDVDMSIYYNPESGDKDARDYMSMLRFKRLRETDEEMDDENRLATFEKHTKGFGSRILKEQGWSEGEGVGRTKEGIAIPIDDAGQHPWDRSGFGYRGEKLVRTFEKKKRKRRRGEAFISTIYDRPQETDPPDPLLRSHDTTYLHFRKSFVKGKELQ
uniref:G-patch domain-containing protein n=1 Tax=Amblyomma maculatum TaxID=34609 RepID=G3MM85_AMBMU